MPMPPSWAMAIASRASVTVSIAAETSGRFSVMRRDSRVARLVSRGNTCEKAGTSNTSSKVSALPSRRMLKAPDAKTDYQEGARGAPDGVMHDATSGGAAAHTLAPCEVLCSVPRHGVCRSR
ncbi:MAG: hypothetical protein U5L05_17025 [Rubrivivax sp.]|nr:hypothetical protein [Rubrivivax sp.]